MRVQFMDAGNAGDSVITTFGGRIHTESVPWGSFYETKNLSCIDYPVLSNRKPRGLYRQEALTKPHGLFWKDGLMWADGTSLYFNGKRIGDCTDTDKQFCANGAYIVIFPDKIMYSTEKDTIEKMENEWTGTVSFTSSSIVFPSGVTPSKLGFDQYDGIKITGSAYEQNNTTPIVYEIRDADFQLAETAESDERVNSFYCTKDIFKEESNVTVTLKREVPDLEYICENDNRLWGCRGHEIFASALGAPKCWNRFEGISTDSFDVNVGSESTFTGCGVELGYIIFFKENTFHKIYGTKPSNYQAMASNLRGVAKGSERSITLCNEVLWYLSKDGVMAYGGSTPESVASAFGRSHYENGVGGGISGRYYISMQDTSDNSWHLFVYDIDKQIWMEEDETHVLWFASSGRDLYYIDAADNKIKTISGNTDEVIPWKAEFGDQMDDVPAYKTVSRLYANMWLDAGTEASVYIRYQTDEEWQLVRSLSGAGKRRTVNFPIYPRRYTQFALKIEGTGDFKLYGLTRTLEGSSEIPGEW